MSGWPLRWEGAGWWPVLLVVLLVGAVALALAYRRAPARGGLRVVAALLKLIALLALGAVILEPLFSGERPTSGANLFVLLADNSRSLQLRDRRATQTRAEQLAEHLEEKLPWRVRLAQDFAVRSYAFDTRLRSQRKLSKLDADGRASELYTSLDAVAQRLRGRPVAGVLVFTDGNATDKLDSLRLDKLPPIYPVLVGRDLPARDVRIVGVSVTQSNFETAPVAIQAEIAATGYRDQELVVQLLDEDDEELEQKVVSGVDDDQPQVLRFSFRPDAPGIRFYRVRAYAKAEGPQFETPERSAEATLANNTRIALVDRGGGPYRILYVAGRPNWEFKFMRRALDADEEVQLVGLVRIANREPKFDFRSRRGERTNPLFRGFDNQKDEQAEQYDEPVLLRLSTEDETELRDGFPKAADQLFRYHALILDDLEATFFTQDQMLLIQKFVSHRGGGVLMLGGQESFAKGKYARTPLGELLPVYMEGGKGEAVEGRFRLNLTRDGLHPPWSFFRVRGTLGEEQRRLREISELRTVNRVSGVKPGATVLAEAVEAKSGEKFPALVAQRFGSGRASALLLGDLWRWEMKRKLSDDHDVERIWRQTLRWLVADVPQRVQSQVLPPKTADLGLRIRTQVRDAEFKPLDNATVRLRVKTPQGKPVELTADPSESAPGVYEATFVSRQPGAYLARVEVAGPDGSDVGKSAVGWTSEPDLAEFARLRPDRDALQQLAQKTDGEIVSLDSLDGFVASLSRRKVPMQETWVYSWWELPFRKLWAFLVLIAALTGEWGIRRWNGLP